MRLCILFQSCWRLGSYFVSDRYQQYEEEMVMGPFSFTNPT